MTRSELIEQISYRRSDIDYKLVEFSVKRIIDYMITNFEAGSRLEIRGFGSFSLRKRKPRNARNPKTGQLVETESKYVLYFRPGKQLKELVNESFLKELSLQKEQLSPEVVLEEELA